jgi:hypothetical protein
MLARRQSGEASKKGDSLVRRDINRNNSSTARNSIPSWRRASARFVISSIVYISYSSFRTPSSLTGMTNLMMDINLCHWESDVPPKDRGNLAPTWELAAQYARICLAQTLSLLCRRHLHLFSNPSLSHMMSAYSLGISPRKIFLIWTSDIEA